MSEHVYWRHYEDGTSQLRGVRVTWARGGADAAWSARVADEVRQQVSPDWKLPADDEPEDC